MQRAPTFFRITRSDGSPLPLGFRVLSFLPRGPRKLRAGALQKLRENQALLRRLPETLVVYEDGRKFICPQGDRMYAAVLCHGVWEPLESAAIRSVLRAGDHAVDVGANQGWHSIAMASLVGRSGRVWAVEPVPKIRKQLQRNLDYNPGLPVTLIPRALGASSGTVLLHIFDGLPEGHASISTLGRTDFTTYSASQATLDDLIAETSARPAFVKVDVEGSDLGVLQGAPSLASATDAPIWLLEVNWDVSRAFGYEPPDLLHYLNECNDYRTFRLTKHGVRHETQANAAPHGSAWLVVPRGRLDRVATLG